MSNEQTQSDFDFGCEYTQNLPEILRRLNVSLALTSYQAGRLILLRSGEQGLELNYKSFPRPMGLCATPAGLTLGTFTQVLHFQREDALLPRMKAPLAAIEEDPTAPRVDGPADDSAAEPVDARVDACYITRSSHYTGMINIHDIAWGSSELWAVNSSFSCLCTLSPEYSFTPRWKPPFISTLAPEDRCHLNGMALRDGRPGYVTTFSKSDQPARWRKASALEGTLIDVQRNEILIDGLSMPHSPRWHEGRVYFCESGRGRVCSYDPRSDEVRVLATLPGFTRGMDFIGSLMLVGLSRLRNSDRAPAPPLAEQGGETSAGLALIDLETGRVAGQLRFTGDVQQIYDVAVLQDCSFPELIEPTHPRMRNHFTYPSL